MKLTAQRVREILLRSGLNVQTAAGAGGDPVYDVDGRKLTLKRVSAGSENVAVTDRQTDVEVDTQNQSVLPDDETKGSLLASTGTQFAVLPPPGTDDHVLVFKSTELGFNLQWQAQSGGGGGDYNIDGGNASSVYTAEQSIDGGGAS